MRIAKLTLAVLVTALAALASSQGLAATEAEVRAKIRSATGAFRDLRMGVEIAYANQKELAVIGKDYGKAYEFKNAELTFKNPDKYKMTARAGIVNVSYIVTGDIKRVKAGLIKKTDDISEEPHKKQSVLDVGVVSDSLWQFYSVDYERTEQFAGASCYVLSLYLSNSPQKKQYIWIDTKDLKLLKREKHEADGSLRVRYTYTKHRPYKGMVWVPGEQRVYNQNGKLGGTSVYKNIRVNDGVADSEFK